MIFMNDTPKSEVKIENPTKPVDKPNDGVTNEEQYDTARYKNEYCYNHGVDGFTEDKYLYEPSITKKRFKKSPKNWYVESHR